MKAMMGMLASSLLLLSFPASGSNAPDFTVGPWRLGMTPTQVNSFTQFGPYTSVETTGGLETRNGEFQGKPTDISFVFDSKGLKFIQVWKYEGKDEDEAQSAVIDDFRMFKAQYGGAKVGNVKVSGGAGLTEDALKAVLGRVLGTARQLSADIGKKENKSVLIMFDMKPKIQPSNSQLDCQWGYSSKFDTFYVFLFQDRHGARPRKVKANVQLGEP